MERRTGSFSPVQGGIMDTWGSWRPPVAVRLRVIGVTLQIPLPSEINPHFQPSSCQTRRSMCNARSIIAKEGTSGALPTQSSRRTPKTSLSSRPVRAGLGRPGAEAADNQKPDGCPSLDPLVLPGSADLNWVIENPISTEVRLLDHTGSPIQDRRASEESLAVPTWQPGEGTRPQWLALGQLPSPHPPSFAYRYMGNRC